MRLDSVHHAGAAARAKDHGRPAGRHGTGIPTQRIRPVAAGGGVRPGHRGRTMNVLVAEVLVTGTGELLSVTLA